MYATESRLRSSTLSSCGWLATAFMCSTISSKRSALRSQMRRGEVRKWERQVRGEVGCSHATRAFCSAHLLRELGHVDEAGAIHLCAMHVAGGTCAEVRMRWCMRADLVGCLQPAACWRRSGGLVAARRWAKATHLSKACLVCLFLGLHKGSGAKPSVLETSRSASQPGGRCGKGAFMARAEGRGEDATSGASVGCPACA